MTAPRPRFFRNANQFRKWLEKHHRSRSEQWIGYYKKHTALASMDWPQSVDAALCFGWIDGLRKSIDADSYMIRFTPRQPNSHWSLVNLRRFERLEKAGLVAAAGKEAYSKRNLENSGRAGHEQAHVELAPELLGELIKHKQAWHFYSQLPPSTMKNSNWWVMSAKQEVTRKRRLTTLIECSGKGELIPPLVWTAKRRQ